MALDKSPRGPGLMQRIRTELEAGKTIQFEDFPGVSRVNFDTCIANLRSAKYCGAHKLPLNIVRDRATKTYRLWRPGDAEKAA